MADPRTFVLIGNFEDNITPALTKINNAVDGFKRNMATLSTKRGGGYNDVTKAVGKLVTAQMHLKDAIEGVGAAAKAATGELKEYKSMMGKVASAQYHVQRSGTAAGKAQSKFWQGANKELEDYGKNMLALQRRTKINPYRSLMGGRGGRSSRAMSFGGPTPPGGGPPGGGYRSVRSGGSRRTNIGEAGLSASFAFGQQLGFGIAQPVQNAIFSGFQLGVGLMARTMSYVQGSFAERVEDQMTDLQTAGGYLSISKRQKNPMFKSLQTSILFTQRTNDVLERLAGELPGSTEDYVKVSKRIGDSVMRLVDSDEKGSIEFAKTLKQSSDTQAYKDISLTGPGARQGALQVILGELTKKTVMAGIGGSVGAGGAAGARGLPALMERLITDPSTSLSSLTKYAAVFGDPKIASALERTMPELEKAGSNMLERTKVINKMLDEIVPPEMVSAQKRTMAGVMEAFRSAFFSPGTGFLGFGRKLKDATGAMQPLTDVYGRFIKVTEENGEVTETVVATAGQASQASMDVFNMFSDIVVNYANIIRPIVDNLYMLWDPLQGIAEALRSVRVLSIKVWNTFRSYAKFLDGIAEGISDEKLKESFLSTKGLRTTLITLANLFTDLGVLSEGQFSTIFKALKDPKTTIEQIGGILKDIVTTFFKSDAAFGVGKFFGEVIKAFGTGLSELTGFAKGLGTSKLAEGFMAGLGDDGIGVIQKIFVDIYELLFEAAKAILPLIPWQFYATAAAGIVIPAVVASLGIALANGIVGMLIRIKDVALSALARGGGEGEIAAALKRNKITQGGAGVGSGLANVTENLTGFRITRGGDGVGTGAARSRVTQGGAGVGSGTARVTQGRIGFGERLRAFAGRAGQAPATISGYLGAAMPTLNDLIGKFRGLGSLMDETLWSRGTGFMAALRAVPDYIFDIIEGNRNPFYRLGAAFQRLANIVAKADDVFIRLLEGNLSARGMLREGLSRAGGAAKGIGVRILGIGRRSIGAARGGLGALLGGAGRGLGGLFNFMGGNLANFKASGMGKFGGIATAGIAIVEGIASLLSGDSLGTALGKAAGPALGTIIGTALLGPIGGIIGGWIGQQKSVVEGLTRIFENVWGALSTFGRMVLTVATDLGNFLERVFNLGSNFDWLGALMRALEAPFYYLRRGMMGIYEWYLQKTGKGSSKEAAALRKEIAVLEAQRQAEQGLKTRNPKLTPEEKLRGVESAIKRMEFNLKSSKDDAEKAVIKAQIEVYKAELERLRKPSSGDPTTPKSGATPVSPLFTTPQVPGQPGAPATQQATQVATDISNLSKKATEQVTKTSETTKAVKDLTNKLTSQNSLQATVTSIYNLLASGNLRVMGAPGGMPPNGYGGLNPNSNGGGPKNKLYNGSVLLDYRTGYSDLGTSSTASNFWTEGAVSVNAPITINGAGKDAKEIAVEVAYILGDAVADAQSRKIFT